MQREGAALGKIVDDGKIGLEMAARTVSGDGLSMFVELIEHEPARLGLIGPEIVAQIASFTARRGEHRVEQVAKRVGLAGPGSENRDDLDGGGHRGGS